jgi:hypothetical protein
MADAPDISVRLDRVLPRLVAHGTTDADRPKSLDEHIASMEATRAALGSSAPVARQYVGYIDLVFVAPFSEGSYIWINYDHLDQYDTSPSEIERIALGNLDDLIGEDSDFKWVRDGIGASFHNFASSFLLSRNFWHTLDIDEQSMTVIIPQRDSLILCMSGGAEEIAYLDSVRGRFWGDPEVPESMKLCEHFILRDANSASGWSMSFAPRRSN